MEQVAYVVDSKGLALIASFMGLRTGTKNRVPVFYGISSPYRYFNRYVPVRRKFSIECINRVAYKQVYNNKKLLLKRRRFQ